MEDNRKYNKRPRSITEFRTSYSDNSKNNRNSTDRYFRRQTVLKYVIVAIFCAVVVLVGFLITDALLTISEEPYVREETTAVTESKTDTVRKQLKEQVTVNADDVDETDTNETDIDDVRE